MHQLLESFLAEDNTGNVFRIDRFQILNRAAHTSVERTEALQYKKCQVTYVGDDIYYIHALDTEVRKI